MCCICAAPDDNDSGALLVCLAALVCYRDALCWSILFAETENLIQQLGLDPGPCSGNLNACQINCSWDTLSLQTVRAMTHTANSACSLKEACT